jgi:hypothetical protein
VVDPWLPSLMARQWPGDLESQGAGTTPRRYARPPTSWPLRSKASMSRRYRRWPAAELAATADCAYCLQQGSSLALVVPVGERSTELAAPPGLDGVQCLFSTNPGSRLSSSWHRRSSGECS